ncbi:MAG: TonB-dependent receptor plug domain-containing protein [Cyclobacteriaceae bacterium]
MIAQSLPETKVDTASKDRRDWQVTSSDQFNQGNINDPWQLIQGRVPGLLISKPGSDPNGNYDVRVRGLSTFEYGATHPLIVIDGMPGIELSSVDPSDIETFRVLKDGQTGVYGIRGASGVVEITTKSGGIGKPRFNWNSFVATESAIAKPSVISASAYNDLLEKRFGVVNAATASTDWVDEITRRSYSYASNFSASGGIKPIQYRAGINYRNVDGIQEGAGFEQINLSLSLKGLLANDRLHYQVNSSYSDRDAQPGYREAFRYALAHYPNVPVRDGNSNYGGYYQAERFQMYNPVAILEQSIKDQKIQSYRLSGHLNYELFEGHKLSIATGTSQYDYFQGEYAPPDAYYQGFSTQGFALIDESEVQSGYYDLSWKGIKELNRFLIGVSAGLFEQRYKLNSFYVTAAQVEEGYENLPNSLVFEDPRLVLDDGLKSSEHQVKAYYGSVSVSLDQAYTLLFNYRHEGSNLLGTNAQWGGFPYLLMSADLAKTTNSQLFDKLEIGLSYGESGSLPQQSALSHELYGPVGIIQYNGDYIRSYDIVQAANSDLSFERSSQWNINTTFSILSNRLEGSIDYYWKKNSDFIIRQSGRTSRYPYSTLPYYDNSFGLSAKGIDLALTYRWPSSKGLRLNTELVFSSINMAYEDLSGENYDYENTGMGRRGFPGECGCTTFNRMTTGQSPGRIMGREVVAISDGRFQYRFQDANGWVQEEDFGELGQGYPTTMLGLSQSVAWRRWNLSTFFRGVFGHSLINLNRLYLQAPAGAQLNNVLTDYPELNNLDFGSEFNDFFVEKASFLRLDNVNVSYTMPMKSNNSVRFYLAANNVFTLTSYRGSDPSPRIADYGSAPYDLYHPSTLGIDRPETWFNTRSFVLGLKLSF